MTRYVQGRFSPMNPQKYRGDVSKIYYRSSWELAFMLQVDRNIDIIEWSSEELAIPYKSIDGKYHRYFVDFIIKHANGTKTLIEIKPKKQVDQPKKPKRITKRYITEVATWVKNRAKWDAAREYATDHGWSFEIMTEKELHIPPG